MNCPLLSDQLLLTSLSQNLVELHLTVYSDNRSQLNFDMDCLSGMSKLRQMNITDESTQWVKLGHDNSRPPQLTHCFGGLCFLNDGMMVGPLMTALGSLPKLTALTTSHIPGGRIEPYSTHFTALKRLVMKYSEREASSLHIAVGLSLSSLCKLSLNICHVVSMPVPWKYLSSLTKVSFDSCEFVLGESIWLSEALEGATSTKRDTQTQMNGEACLVILQHWQKRMQECKSLINNIYQHTKDASMDSGAGRERRLQEIHTQISNFLTPQEKLALYTEVEIEFANYMNQSAPPTTSWGKVKRSLRCRNRWRPVVLEPHINSWCLHEPYNHHTESGMHKPTWRRRDDLWTYSRTDIHCSRIMARAEEKVKQERCVQKYRDAQTRFGIKFSSDERLFEAFCNQADPHIVDMCNQSPEALLFMGANYLVSPLTKAALDMFPGCCVGRLLDDESNEIVVIDNHTKFDFVRFFLTIIS